MPSLFTVCGYHIYFWSNESNEPVHVHVSKGKPTPKSTKVWLTLDGGCIVANNCSNIPSHDLNELLDIISAQAFFICDAWKKYFGDEELRFYC